MTSWELDKLDKLVKQSEDVRYAVAVFDPDTKLIKGFVHRVSEEPHSGQVYGVGYTNDVGEAMLYRYPQNQTLQQLEDSVLKDLDLVGRGQLIAVRVNKTLGLD